MKDIEFIHIPKCAGTSVRKVFDNVTTGHKSFRKHNINADFTFSFVRNPFTRLKSLYRHQHSKDMKGVGGMGFQEWFNRTVVEEDRAWLHNPDYWKPCFWWLSDEEGNIQVDFIGKVETIDKDWRRLCEKIDINVILGKYNQTTPNGEAYTEDMKNVVFNKYQMDLRLWYPNLIQ